MSKASKTNRKGWNTNTALCCDLKMILRSKRFMKPGKDYKGILRRDVECDEFRYDEHYTFIETLSAPIKRNPRVFSGKYITITRRRDGSLHPNFKPMKVDEDFSIEKYATGVANELMWALQDILEK